MKCFVCGQELEEVLPETGTPYRGTLFQTRGHYGSTFFDPMDGSYLELVVCDDCLERKKSELTGTGLMEDSLPIGWIEQKKNGGR